MITPRRTVLQRFAKIVLATSALVVGTPSTRLLRAATGKASNHEEEVMPGPIDNEGFGQIPCDCGPGDWGDGGDGDGGGGGGDGCGYYEC